jgi:archaellum biogenesis protein FlaJ (TadC family)
VNGYADSPHPLKVARVKIERLKGPYRGAQETFWIVTTDQSLSALQMHELAHLRWSIENDAFRALSAAVDSKHVWTRGKNSEAIFEVLMLLMFLAFTLSLAFHAELDRDRLWEMFRLRRSTLAHLVDCFILSLQAAAGAFAPGG